MTLKRKTYVFFLFLLISSNLFAVSKFKIEQISPSTLIQGQTDLTLNIITNAPLTQTTLNENLYSEVLFSSPYIRIKKVDFQNNRVINCIVDVDQFADINKKIDVSVISYDKDGNDTIFEGKKMLEITRESFVDKIIVHTFDGRIKIGQPVAITIRGANFETGKIKVLLMWSGLKPFNVASGNGRQLRFEISAEETARLKAGKYKFYVYSGRGVEPNMEIEVVE